jgi:hypothetical protein
METKRIVVQALMALAFVAVLAFAAARVPVTSAQSFPTATPDIVLQSTPTSAMPTRAPTPEISNPTRYGTSPDGLTYLFHLYDKTTDTVTFYTVDRRTGQITNLFVLPAKQTGIMGPGGQAVLEGP